MRQVQDLITVILTEGCAIRSCNGVNVIIDTKLKRAYTAQSCHQEWVTSLNISPPSLYEFYYMSYLKEIILCQTGS